MRPIRTFPTDPQHDPGASMSSSGIRRASAAPLRRRLTQTFGCSVHKLIGFPGELAPLTFLLAVPIEAPCYAVRLGFVNYYDFPLTIQSATVFPSDSYGLCSQTQNAGPNGQVAGLGP